VLFAFVVLGLVHTVPGQEIGWDKCIWNNLLAVLCRVGCKTLNHSVCHSNNI